jgi:hypothetical protein
MPESLHEQIDRERGTTQPNAADLETYRLYAAGEHTSTLTPRQKAILGGASRQPYSDNVADMVIAAWSNRLKLRGFHCEDEGVQTFLDEFYTHNQLASMSYDINYAVGRDGNHAVILRWLPDDAPPMEESDNEEPPIPPRVTGGQVTAHNEDWWDGKQGVWVAYDDRGRPAYAVKDFVTLVGDPPHKADRRTVYFTDRIERYIKDGGGWQPYPLPDEPWPVPWVKQDGAPLGIPVIHYSFPRFGKRRYGISELAGGFLGNQDHINDMQQDLTAAARLLGFQILWSTGIEWAENPVLEPGVLLHADAPDAAFGVLPAGDIKQIRDAHGTKLQTIARMTMTPIHIIQGGTWPAGIALVQADKPLIAKCMRLMESIGPSHTTKAHRATEMANAFGGAGLNEDALITSVFADPEQLDQLAQAELDEAKAKALKAREELKDRKSLIDIGLTEEEVEEILTDREEQAQKAMELAMQSQQAAADGAAQREQVA